MLVVVVLLPLQFSPDEDDGVRSTNCDDAHAALVLCVATDRIESSRVEIMCI